MIDIDLESHLIYITVVNLKFDTAFYSRVKMCSER